MKIAIIGTVGVPVSYGGFETLAEFLVRNLAKEFDITVYCTAQAYPEKPKYYKSAKCLYLPLKANGAQALLYDTISIIHALFYADRLLLLGTPGAFILPLVKVWTLFTKQKIIVNIDGKEWERSKWSKPVQKLWYFLTKMAIWFSDEIIADNKGIQQFVTEKFNKPSHLIAYGGDHVTEFKDFEEVKKTYPFLDQEYGFVATRIEPENNVHTILEVFAELKKYNLFFVGNWHDNDYAKSLRKKYEDCPYIEFIDYIKDLPVLNTIRAKGSFYVHGHSVGGTNPSLVEAMSAGLPVIANDVIYNRETTDNKAIFFSDKESLIKALKELSPEKLREVGKDMKKVAAERYTWQHICDQYKQAFNAR